MSIVMSGLDYNLAPISLREQLSFTRTMVEELDRRIGSLEGVEGCVLLSTCNRTELYLCLSGGRELDPGEALCQAVGLPHAPFAHAFLTRRGSGAARHLMEVAGGLRSQIWGEDQIITQVKTAIAIAREAGTAGPMLETLFRNAVSAGKEIKTKVRLTGVATSAAGRAVEVLEREFGSLLGKKALVIGNGEMGRLAATLLRERGCEVTVTLRTYRHGETVVPAGCGVVPYDERLGAMEGMDLLLSATTSPHYTVTAEQIAGLDKPPAFAVDLAMPRDIQPQVGELSGVTLYNVDTLGAECRRVVPPQVGDVLDEYMGRFYEWYNYRRCLPAIEELKTAILARVRSYPEAELADPEDMAELAVSTAVNLLTGGLKEKFAPEDLERCVEKIQLHTTAKALGKERSHEKKPIPFPAVP